MLALVLTSRAGAQALQAFPPGWAEALDRPAAVAPPLTADAPPRATYNAQLLAALLPALQPDTIRATLVQDLALHQQLEGRYGWPRNDVAGAAALFLTGNYMAMTGTPVSNEQVAAVAAQLRGSAKFRAALQARTPQDLRDFYEQQAMVGMFMVLSQMAHEQQPLPPERLTRLRDAARAQLRQALQRDPAQLSIGPQGLVIASVPARPAGVAGTLWHNSYTLNSTRGVQLSPLGGGASTQVTHDRDSDVSIWPDGRQYLVTRWQVRPSRTAITVIDRATGNTVYERQAEGYLSAFQPSPVDKRLVIMRQSEGPRSSADEHVLDLATMRSRRAIADEDQVAWMPDGRLMLIGIQTGRMRAVGVDGGPEQAVGHLPVPADRVMGQFKVSPTGRQLVVALSRRGGATRETDLWIANIDGTGLEQLTEVRAFGGATWSPDGRHVAYKVDTGHACSTAGFCTGSCDQYYTPVELRKVRGLDGTPGSLSFSVDNRFGSKEKLSCSVLAWTP